MHRLVEVPRELHVEPRLRLHLKQSDETEHGVGFGLNVGFAPRPFTFEVDMAVTV